MTQISIILCVPLQPFIIPSFPSMFIHHSPHPRQQWLHTWITHKYVYCLYFMLKKKVCISSHSDRVELLPYSFRPYYRLGTYRTMLKLTDTWKRARVYHQWRIDGKQQQTTVSRDVPTLWSHTGSSHLPSPRLQESRSGASAAQYSRACDGS